MKIGKNRRWFTIEHIGGGAVIASEFDCHKKGSSAKMQDDLALCYYKTPSSTEKSGWIFLADVKGIAEIIDQHMNNPNVWIHIIHPSRVFKLHAVDAHDHTLWIRTLRHICNVDTNGDIIEKATFSNPADESKVLEAASATYVHDDFSYNETKRPLGIIEKDHEAEMNFMKQITSANNGIGSLEHSRKDSIECSYDIETEKCIPWSPTHSIHTLDDSPYERVISVTSEKTDDGFIDNDSGNIKTSSQTEETKLCTKNPIGASPNVIKDHRLLPIVNSSDMNGSIHKRIERAILETNQEVQDKQNHIESRELGSEIPALVKTNPEIVTMVENFTYDRQSSETSSKESFITNDSDLDMSMLDQATDMETRKSSTSRQLKLGDILFKNDVLSLNHEMGDSHTKRSFVCEETADIDFVMSDWDDNLNLEESTLHEKSETSFETGCSYRPDENFVDEDWDD